MSYEVKELSSDQLIIQFGEKPTMEGVFEAIKQISLMKGETYTIDPQEIIIKIKPTICQPQP